MPLSGQAFRKVMFHSGTFSSLKILHLNKERRVVNRKGRAVSPLPVQSMLIRGSQNRWSTNEKSEYKISTSLLILVLQSQWEGRRNCTPSNTLPISDKLMTPPGKSKACVFFNASILVTAINPLTKNDVSKAFQNNVTVSKLYYSWTELFSISYPWFSYIVSISYPWGSQPCTVSRPAFKTVSKLLLVHNMSAGQLAWWYEFTEPLLLDMFWRPAQSPDFALPDSSLTRTRIYFLFIGYSEIHFAHPVISV